MTVSITDWIAVAYFSKTVRGPGQYPFGVSHARHWGTDFALREGGGESGASPALNRVGNQAPTTALTRADITSRRPDIGHRRGHAESNHSQAV